MCHSLLYRIDWDAFYGVGIAFVGPPGRERDVWSIVPVAQSKMHLCGECLTGCAELNLPRSNSEDPSATSKS